MTSKAFIRAISDVHRYALALNRKYTGNRVRISGSSPVEQLTRPRKGNAYLGMTRHTNTVPLPESRTQGIYILRRETHHASRGVRVKRIRSATYALLESHRPALVRGKDASSVRGKGGHVGAVTGR